MKPTADRGWRRDLRHPDAAEAEAQAELAKASYDCIAIGTGLRNPMKILPLVEIINTVREEQAAQPLSASRGLPMSRHGPDTASFAALVADALGRPRARQ